MRGLGCPQRRASHSCVIWVARRRARSARVRVGTIESSCRGEKISGIDSILSTSHDRTHLRTPYLCYAPGRSSEPSASTGLTLAAGESIVAVKCSSTAIEFTSEITFQTSQGRAIVFGSHGTIIPWGPPDEMSTDGAPLVGFVALRTVLAPWVDWRSPNMEAIDVYGGATLVPIACYFSTAWKRRRSLVLLKALVKKRKATPAGLLWSRVLDADFEEGLWRHVVRCL